MNRTKWVERKFNFDFPIGVMPNIIERLKGTPVRIKEMVDSLSDEELQRSFENKWSIKMEIGHLIDLEELHTARIEDFIARKETLRAADMTNAKTNNSNYNLDTISDLLNRFAYKRSEFIAKLESLNEETLKFTSSHPRLQIMMRPVDLAYFVAEHDDHHLATMRGILNNMIANGIKQKA